MLLALAALACLKPAPPEPLELPVPPEPTPLACPWTWEGEGLSDGTQRWALESAWVVDTNGDAAPDLLANLSLCGAWGDCELLLMQGCGDGSFKALWGPEYAQYIEVRGIQPLVMARGGRTAMAGCDVPSEQLLRWEGQWEDLGTCYEEGPWDVESCGARPGPACERAQPAGSEFQCDVKLLAAFWNMDEAQALTRIRDKFGGTYAAGLAAELASAKASDSAACAPAELGYSSADVAALQAHLGPDQDAEGALFQAYKRGALRELTRAAGMPSAIDPAVVLEEEGYTACDAAQLAALWGTESPEPRMAEMLLGEAQAELNSALRGAYAADPVACAWHQTGFDAVEIQALAHAWKLTPDQAALRVAERVSAGQHAQVLRELP